MTAPSKGEIHPRKRRRVIAFVVLRALLTVTVLVALYYTLPIDEEWRLSAGVRAVVGLVLFIAVPAGSSGRSPGRGIRASGRSGRWPSRSRSSCCCSPRRTS